MTSSKRGSGRPPAGDTSVRDALLRAGATHFSMYGFAGANIRSILADAGATAPAMYHHFGNKTGLYIAAATAAQEHVLHSFSEAIVGTETVQDKMSALLSAAAAIRREHPNVAKYLSVVQQDVERHPELAELALYQAQFDRFWQSLLVASRPAIAVATALRAVIEGFLAVGGADLRPKDIVATADMLNQIACHGIGSITDR